MQGYGLRQNLTAYEAITPLSVVVYHTTENYVKLPAAAKAGNIAGVIQMPFNKNTIAAGDVCAVVTGGEVTKVRKLSGVVFAAGDPVMIGDATGAVTKLVDSGDAAYYAVGWATQPAESTDVYVEIAVSPQLALLAVDGVFAGDITLQNGEKIGNATNNIIDLTSAAVNLIGGTTGGLKVVTVEATATLSGSSTDIAVNIPSGAIILGTQLRVDTAVTSGDGATSWAGAYKTGATQAITTGQAFTKNTKVNKLFDANAATAIASGTTVIAITPDSHTFSGGVIRAISYYLTFTTMADAA